MEKQNECAFLADKYTILPDKEHFRFLRTIEADVLLAVNHSRSYLFRRLQEETIFPRLIFVREPDNPYDANAVRIERLNIYSESGEEIGYVPRACAKELAPMIDAGRLFTGWIRSVDGNERKIQVDIYERQIFPYIEIADLELHEGGNLFATDVRISVPERKFFFKGRYNFCDEYREVEMLFSVQRWNDLVLPVLRKCNFPAWYDEYIDPCIRDGLEWKMKIRLESGEVRESRGSNEVPEEWKILQRFISVCRCMSEEKVEGISSSITFPHRNDPLPAEPRRFSDRVRNFVRSLRKKLFRR